MDAMRAEFEIRQLHARYAHAIFRADAEAVAALFAEDGEWRVGGQIMRGRQEIVAFLSGVFPQFRRLLMLFYTPLVSVTQEEISARTFVVERSQFADGTPFAPFGIYFDRFVEADGQLLFSWRLFQTHYAGPPDMASPFFDVPDFGRPPAMPSLDAETIDRSGVGARARGG